MLKKAPKLGELLFERVSLYIQVAHVQTSIVCNQLNVKYFSKCVCYSAGEGGMFSTCIE